MSPRPTGPPRVMGEQTMRYLCVLASLLLIPSCKDEGLRNIPPPDVQVDAYFQRAASKVDVLWVVDDSGSMAPRQENLAKNFASFIDLFSRASIDFRIGVATTDIFKTPGQLRGSPKVLTPKTPSLATAFAGNIRVGTSGSPYESGMQAAQLVLDAQKAANEPKQAVYEACRVDCATAPVPDTCELTCDGKAGIDFLRPDAYLYVIFVTDEEDESAQDVRYFWRYFETIKGVGNDGLVTTAAIAGDVPKNTCGATPGARYKQLSDLTGGELGSICDESFASTLRKLATSAVGLKRKFALSKAPNEATLAVKLKYPCNTPAADLAPCASVDKAQCAGNPDDSVNIVCVAKQGGPDGWSYEAGNNLIYFAGDSVPGLKAEVDIEYYEAGKGPP